jgi:hypothetical protein
MKLRFLTKTLFVTCFLVFFSGCTPQWEKNGFPNESSFEKASELGFKMFHNYEVFVDGEFDNKNQWQQASILGITSKEIFLIAEKNNVNSKKKWEQIIISAKKGNFIRDKVHRIGIERYFEAKKLGLNSSKQLMDHVLAEAQKKRVQNLIEGAKNFGKTYAEREMCYDVLLYIPTQSNKKLNLHNYYMREILSAFNEYQLSFLKEETVTEVHKNFNNARKEAKKDWNERLESLLLNNGNAPLAKYFSKNCKGLVNSACMLSRITDKTKDIAKNCDFINS